MQDEQQHYALHCDWEPCNRRLVEFCFVCNVKDKFDCDFDSLETSEIAESPASDISVSSSISHRCSYVAGNTPEPSVAEALPYAALRGLPTDPAKPASRNDPFNSPHWSRSK